MRAVFCEYTPMKRMATPLEIAASVLYLALAEVGFDTGATLQNDDGSTTGH